MKKFFAKAEPFAKEMYKTLGKLAKREISKEIANQLGEIYLHILDVWVLEILLGFDRNDVHIGTVLVQRHVEKFRHLHGQILGG